MPVNSSKFDKLDLPKIYIESAPVAKKVADNAARSHSKYREKIRLQQEHLEGKPPYDPAKLKANSQSWRNNWPRYKARAKTEKLVVEEMSNFNNALAMGEVAFVQYDEDTHKKDKQKAFLTNDSLRRQYSAVISQVYADLWDMDDRAVDFLQTVSYETVNWGWCFTTCEEGDWLGDAHKVLNVGFPPRQRPDQIKTAVFTSTFTALELYKKWADLVDGNEGKTGEDGDVYVNFWNREGMEDALYNAYQKKEEGQDYWKQIETTYTQHLALSLEQSDTIYITRIINEEDDGSVTDTLIEYTAPFSGVNITTTVGDKLLYQRNYPKMKFGEITHLFRDSNITSTGVVQDMRGVAQYSVSDGLRHDRAMNHIEDLLQITGGLTFQQDSVNMGDKFDLYVAGPYTILPVNYSLAENVPTVNLTNHMAFRQMEENSYLRETGHFDPSIQGKLGDRATTAEVEVASGEIGRSKRSKQGNKVKNWQRFHASALKRISKKGKYSKGDEAYEPQKWFIREIRYLLDLKKDEEVFAILEEVDRFELELFNGDSQALLELLRLTQSPAERNEIMRRYKMSLGIGRRLLDKVHPRFDQAAEVMRDEQLAQLENGMFGTSVPPLFSEEDVDTSHLNVHFRYLAEIPNQVQGGAMDPLKGAKIMVEGLQHTPLHIRAISEDPLTKGQEGQYMLVQRQLESIAKEMEQAAEAAAQQMAARQNAQQNNVEEDGARARDLDQKTEARESAHQQKTRHNEEKHQQGTRQGAEKSTLDLAEKERASRSELAANAAKEATSA